MEALNNNDLDKETLEQIKQDLLDKKKQILKDLNVVFQEDIDNPDHHSIFPQYGDKPDENAQEISEYTTNLATDQILESSLRDIDSALERIEKGTYGICKYCSKPIGKKRLQARPVASACIDCKNQLQGND